MFVRVRDMSSGLQTWINTDHIRHIDFSGEPGKPSSLLFWFASGEKAVPFIQAGGSFEEMNELITRVSGGESYPTTQA